MKKITYLSVAFISYGFTLIELMVTIVVATILLLVAVPSFNNLVDTNRLMSATSMLYSDLQFARSEAIRNNNQVQLNFNQAASCYGMILGTAACDCTVTSTAATNFCGLKRVTSANLGSITVVSFASPTGFDPVRGMILSATAGSVTLQSASGKQARVNIGLLGRISLCSPAGTTGVYPSC